MPAASLCSALRRGSFEAVGAPRKILLYAPSSGFIWDSPLKYAIHELQMGYQMWWDKFSPEEHGDAYERVWWHFIEDDFPEWGTFWSHHIVPLTNRIVDGFQGNAQAKLHIRFDPNINSALEALVMNNYSVFYYLARSSAIVTAEPHLFLEDAFIFLRAAVENAGQFLPCFKDQVAPAFGIDASKVPDWKSLKAGPLFKEIIDYRDAFAHRARLGRNPNVSWEFIPKHSHLGKAKFSWRYIQDLPEDQFVDGRKHVRTPSAQSDEGA